MPIARPGPRESSSTAVADADGASPRPAPAADRWREAVQAPPFRALIRVKTRILVPLTVLYLGTFFAVMLLAGYARPLMGQPVQGSLSLGYVLILGLYVMCWVLSVVYAWLADRVFDPAADRAAADIAGRR